MPSLPYRPAVERLEDRLTPNAQWGYNGPPLKVNTNQAPAKLVTLLDGDAAGAGKITSRNEVDYYRFTTGVAGFYELSATADTFDVAIGVYTKAAKGRLLGFADAEARGTEQFTVYLEADTIYVLAVSNFLTGKHGQYGWAIDAVTAGSPVSAAERTLYINFDGAELDAVDLQSWDDDWEFGDAAEFDPRGDGVVVQPFLASRGDREAIISGIVALLEADLAPFGVTVVRLAAGASAVAGVGATTIFAGPATLEDLPLKSPHRDLFHVAGDIDVGNDNLTDIAFVDDEKWGSAQRAALALADVFLHEAGHTFGLYHVKSGRSLESMGRRYSLDQRFWVADTRFLNRSFRYRGGGGSQNSFQELARVFGVDAVPPPPPAAEAALASNKKQEDGVAGHPTSTAWRSLA